MVLCNMTNALHHFQGIVTADLAEGILGSHIHDDRPLYDILFFVVGLIGVVMAGCRYESGQQYCEINKYPFHACKDTNKREIMQIKLDFNLLIRAKVFSTPVKDTNKREKMQIKQGFNLLIRAK